MNDLKILKHIYDKLNNDYLRSTVLSAAGMAGIRKSLIRMDTNCCCNLHCIMCNSKSSCQGSRYMKLEEFKKIMDQFGPETRLLYLSCAFEPLMTPNFSEYLKYAKEKGIPHISFCTNGLLLNEKLMQTLIQYEIDEIILSFNGFCKQDYNRIMKGSDFDKVRSNLRKLADMKKQSHAEKPKIRMNTVLLKSNILHLDEMLEFVQENDIDLVQFRELVLYEDQNDPLEVEKELPQNQSPEEYEKMIQAVQNIVERLGVYGKRIILPLSIVSKSTSSFATEMSEDIYPLQTEQSSAKKVGESYSDKKMEKKRKKQKHHCSIPFFSYWIDYIGNVRVCGYDDKGNIGNALSDPPKLLKKRQKEFQKLALAGKCIHEKCTINVDRSTIL